MAGTAALVTTVILFVFFLIAMLVIVGYYFTQHKKLTQNCSTGSTGTTCSTSTNCIFNNAAPYIIASGPAVLISADLTDSNNNIIEGPVAFVALLDSNGIASNNGQGDNVVFSSKTNGAMWNLVCLSGSSGDRIILQNYDQHTNTNQVFQAIPSYTTSSQTTPAYGRVTYAPDPTNPNNAINADLTYASVFNVVQVPNSQNFYLITKGLYMAINQSPQFGNTEFNPSGGFTDMNTDITLVSSPSQVPTGYSAEFQIVEQ